MQTLNSIKIATCPACGLMCDDVAVNSSTGKPTTNHCDKSTKFFTTGFNASADATIKGKKVDLEHALQAAADILNKSEQPLFAGLGTEVTGMRALIDLVKKSNGTLDHMHSEGTVNNTLSMQNMGYQTTTMTEVKNRADVILAIGTDIVGSHPRFFEKLIWNQESLFNKPTPEVIFLGAAEAEAIKAATAPDGKKPTVIAVEKSALPEVVNVLNALLNSKNPIQKKSPQEIIGGVSFESLKNLVEKLQKAQYGVVVWSASSLKAIPQAELITQSIIKFINELNETNRIAGLPLNSGDGDTSVNNASTWITSFPTRSRFVNGVPSYNAHAFSTKKQLVSCDALLWISSFNPIAAPKTEAPTIVIGHPASSFEHAPDVFIPVAVPGIHQGGSMFRMDSSVTLPLTKLTDSALPTLATVLQKIESLLA
jgi:formylmethanofuran dehydrogenase subunit B